MKRDLTVCYDDSTPDRVTIATADGSGDPWIDLSILLEGVGVLATACINQGIKEHKGQPLEDYLKDYIGKVCNDYKTFSVM